MSKNVAVIGSGGTALYAAAALTLQGVSVALADIPSKEGIFNIVREQGGILLHGSGPRGIALPKDITTDVAGAVKKADVVIVSATATRHLELAEAVAPGVHDGQVIVIVPGNAGSIIFTRTFEKLGVKADAPILELQGNLSSTRVTAPAAVIAASGFRKKRAAAFPANRTEEAVRRLEGILEVEPAKNIFETTLNTPNVIIHLTATILNTTQIDKAGPKFHLFLDGLTNHVFQALDKSYEELSDVLDALGYWKQANPADHIRRVADYDHYPELNTFRSLAGPDSLQHRYISEDAPSGVSLLVSLAKKVGVEVPFTQSILTIASALNQTDYYAVGRTLENFGLADLSIEEINRYLETGE